MMPSWIMESRPYDPIVVTAGEGWAVLCARKTCDARAEVADFRMALGEEYDKMRSHSISCPAR